jgi:hypothetical protein
VRNPLTMQKKYADFSKLWTGQPADDENKTTPVQEQRFDYSNIDSVTLFEGTHPAVMKALANKEDWNFDMDIRKKNFKNAKHRILYFLWRKFGWRPFEYSNYKRI